MKKNNPIARAGAVVLSCFILVAFVVTASFAYKGSVDAGGAAETVSCEDRTDLLSLFPVTKIRPASNGSVAGLEVHLSSADGHCSKMIFSSLGPGESINADHFLDTRDRAITLR